MSSYGTRDGEFAVKKLKFKKKAPVTYNIPYLAVVSSTAVLAGWDVSAGSAAKYATAYSSQPPYAMELVVNAVAAGTAGGGDKMVFKGYDGKGKYIEESVNVGGTAHSYHYTNNAFAKISSIEPDDALHKSTDVNIGYRGVIGLPYPIDSNSDIISQYIGGVVATTLPTIDGTYDNLTLAGTTAGSAYSVTYMTKYFKD